MKLEDLTTGTRVRGLLPDGVATVKSAQWFGDHGVELIFTDAHGTLQQRIVYREDEPRIELVQGGRPWSFDGDGHLLRLVSEAQRIHLAWGFDFGQPGFAQTSASYNLKVLLQHGGPPA
jgi:hypothetical protein